MGQGSSYFVFIILEIPVPHIPKTHNSSPFVFIYFWDIVRLLHSVTRVPSLRHLSYQLFRFFQSFVPLRFTQFLQSTTYSHWFLLSGKNKSQSLLFYRKKHNFYHFLNFRVIFVHFSSIFFIFTYFSPLKQQKFNENPYI